MKRRSARAYEGAERTCGLFTSETGPAELPEVQRLMTL